MDSFRQSIFTVEARVRKVFGGVNRVLGKTGGVLYTDKV